MTPRPPRHPHQHHHVPPFTTLRLWQSLLLALACTGVAMLAAWLVLR